MRAYVTSVVSYSVLLCCNLVFAQEPAALRTISVSGTVVTETPPDVIVWSVNLTNQDKDIRAAKQANDDHVKSILGLREKLGIDPTDLTTGRVHINREYERDEHGRQGDFKQFKVRRHISIRQRDFGRFDEFLDTLVSTGDLDIGFDFESTQIRDVRAQTRLKAVEVAMEKAAAMAKAAGAELGIVLAIDEHGPDGNNRLYPQGNRVFIPSSDIRPEIDLASGTSVPGAITVKVTVFATFGLK